jgi:hypothetical protein
MTSDGFCDNIPKPPKQKYLLQGPFWEGFRSGAKYWIFLYWGFFLWLTLRAETIWQALFALVMVLVSTVGIYLAWRKN